MADDLSAPLGLNNKPKPRRAVPVIVPRAVVAVLGLFVIIVGGWAMIADDPFGGEPVAVAPARLAASGGAPSQAMAKPSMTAAANEHRYDGPDAAAAAAPPPAGRTITIIDGTSGKRHDVVIPDSRGQTTEDRRRTSAAGR